MSIAAEHVVVVAAAIALLVWVLWVSANRLDRLHRKVFVSRVTLENQLVRRAGVAAELASAGLLDLVSSMLVAEAAFVALDAHDWDEPGTGREVVESELSGTLRAALEDPDEVTALRQELGGAQIIDDLAAAWYRVQLARRFHNEAVAQTQRVRRKVLVRLVHLAGHAPVPQTVELDDAWPDALPRPGSTLV